jgi:hypothetical protein
MEISEMDTFQGEIGRNHQILPFTGTQNSRIVPDPKADELTVTQGLTPDFPDEVKLPVWHIKTIP